MGLCPCVCPCVYSGHSFLKACSAMFMVLNGHYGGSLSALFVKVSILKPSPWTQGASVCLCVCVCVCVISCHLLLGAPRALKFGTWDPWDITYRPLFSFFKILKFDPSRSIFDLFLTYFLKSGANFFWLVQILSFFGFGSSWGVARAPFLNFSKICIFAPVTDVRRF